MKNSLTQAIAIFGYNNSRIYDVQKLRLLAADKGAVIVLVKEGITEQDRAVTPYCFDAKPESPSLAKSLNDFLNHHNLKLMGCLPFSDKGVIGAAYVAREFGLFCDDELSAQAMLDKSKFRLLEKEYLIDSTLYRKPFFQRVDDIPSLQAFFKKIGVFFIKPASEGNSRGCMKITTSDELEGWIQDHGHYLCQGVMCEEYLSSGNEYSFDGVNGSYWITEKHTTNGAFRAEFQHIIPAPLAANMEAKIHKILRPLLKQLGSKGGAFHHEFFILPDQRLASVEPNRRPAGMWLWDLASWSFENFNPWKDWMDLCCGDRPGTKALKPVCYSGVRGVISNRTGSLESIDRKKIENQFNEVFGFGNYRLSFLKGEGSQVTDDPKDNSDFLGFVALRHENPDELKKQLALANKIFCEALVVRT